MPKRKAIKFSSRLSPKQKKLLKIKLKHPDLSLSEAGIQAGYAPGTARQSAWRALSTENVHIQFRDALNKVGLTALHIAKTVQEATKAKRIQYFADHGRVRDRRVHIDNSTRLAAIDLAAKLHGATTTPRNTPDDPNNSPRNADPTLIQMTKSELAMFAKALETLDSHLSTRTKHVVGE